MSKKIQRLDLDSKYDNNVIIGVDEVGNGSIIGPIVACAAMASPNDQYLMDNVRDSKKLSPKKRMEIALHVREKGLPYTFGEVGIEEINRNQMQAKLHAMTMAATKLVYQYWENPPCIEYLPPIVIVDGNQELPFGGFVKQEAIAGADDKFLAVGVASIMAKVHRDLLIKVWDFMYPEYGFKTNMGYYTDKHAEAMMRFGPSPIHRDTAPMRKGKARRTKSEAVPDRPRGPEDRLRHHRLHPPGSACTLHILRPFRLQGDDPGLDDVLHSHLRPGRRGGVGAWWGP
jgi:ribonuclease HII